MEQKNEVKINFEDLLLEVQRIIKTPVAFKFKDMKSAKNFFQFFLIILMLIQ